MERTIDLLEVRREIEIAASQETVWELLTDPAKVVQLVGPQRDVRPARGRQVPHGGDVREASRAGSSPRSSRRAGSPSRSAGSRAAPGRASVPPARARCRSSSCRPTPGRCYGSCTGACRTPRPSRATARAGITTSAGWPSPPPAATRRRPVALRGDVNAPAAGTGNAEEPWLLRTPGAGPSSRRSATRRSIRPRWSCRSGRRSSATSCAASTISTRC